MTVFHDLHRDLTEREVKYEERAFPHPDDDHWYKIRVKGVLIDDREDRRWDHAMGFGEK